MNLARIAIGNSRITLIGMFLLVAVGITTFLNYPSAEDPTIRIRSASIEASYPGMSAERVEELIAAPIETAMREIAEVHEIKSTSRTGSVKVSIEIDELIDDLPPVWQKVRNKVGEVRVPQGPGQERGEGQGRGRADQLASIRVHRTRVCQRSGRPAVPARLRDRRERSPLPTPADSPAPACPSLPSS